MTRKVTVTFDDGTQKVYTGIPDASTPAMIEAKVKKEYPNKKIKNIHGEKEVEKPAATPNSDATPNSAVTPAPAAPAQKKQYNWQGYEINPDGSIRID